MVPTETKELQALDEMAADEGGGRIYEYPYGDWVKGGKLGRRRVTRSGLVSYRIPVLTGPWRGWRQSGYSYRLAE